MTSQIQQEIIAALKRNGIIKGTEHLTIIVATANCKTYILKQVRALESNGVLTVIRSQGGRGAKTIYKRNPNQPGQPRRKRGGTR